MKLMRELLSSKYIPFGSQYYRAPSPHKDDWERDLKNMASYDFNTVKFWIQWRWNNPEEGKFYFDDIDQLMEIAYRNKLKVMLNTIFDVAPAWIYKKFPDASMITLSGKKIGPQTQPHRQIGGLGYCFNHDGVAKYFFEFLKESIKRYKDHPALEIWNVGSEPELTSSMAEMREYSDDVSKIGDMLCYCENCQRRFKAWLEQKYRSIKNLNESWNRNYISFDDIEVPKTRNTFNDVIDWRMFFVYTLGQNVKKRFETAKEIDQGKHPLMCHHVFIQGFPVTSTANDPWNIGQYGDLHGFTQMDDAAMIDVLRSCAKDKPVISAEMLMLPGYTLDLPEPIDENDIKRFVFRGVAGNLKGFIFWQYRPEILGREAPTWGLTYSDGVETPWLKSFSETGKVLQKNTDLIFDGKPRNAEIAILYNPENQVFAWASSGNEKNATNSLLGYHRALYERNFIIDFIHPKEFANNILEKYKVLIIPFPYVLNEELCSSIKSWVKKGGTLIGEAYFAGWNLEHGHHEKVIPGCGLDKVFKVKQAVVEPVDKENRIEIIPVKNISSISRTERAKGTIVRETYFLNGAKVFATYSNNEPAITYADYGKGKAILIGTYLGLAYSQTNEYANADFIEALVEMSVNISKPIIKEKHKIRVDELANEKNKSMIILQNLEKSEVNTSITLLEKKNLGKLTEQFTNEVIEPRQNGKLVEIEINLKAGEVKVFCD